MLMQSYSCLSLKECQAAFRFCNNIFLFPNSCPCNFVGIELVLFLNISIRANHHSVLVKKTKYSNSIWCSYFENPIANGFKNLNVMRFGMVFYPIKAAAKFLKFIFRQCFYEFQQFTFLVLFENINIELAAGSYSHRFE